MSTLTLPTFRACEPQAFGALLSDPGTAQLIDVREPVEYACERLTAVRMMPLTQFPQLAARLDQARPVYILCRSGNRARLAADQLMALGFADVYVVTGGLLACSEAGLPVEKGPSRMWPLERQVRLAAGLLVLIGAGAGALIHPAWYGLAAFVGAGLTFAGLTDTCAMGMLLARMPWNQRVGGELAVCRT
jgi:rhodanese-related sulfurtransferase